MIALDDFTSAVNEAIEQLQRDYEAVPREITECARGLHRLTNEYICTTCGRPDSSVLLHRTGCDCLGCLAIVAGEQPAFLRGGTTAYQDVRKTIDDLRALLRRWSEYQRRDEKSGMDWQPDVALETEFDSLKCDIAKALEEK